MSTAIVAASLEETMTLGNVLAQSGFFADSRQAAQAVVKVLAGRELGFGPIASMTGINIIKGKVALSANLMAAAVKRSGRYDYQVKQLTDQTCEIAFLENGKPSGVSTFSMDDAKRAGLLDGDTGNWKRYPKNMLFARAISNGAKWYCPDLSGGPMYTPDELGEKVDGETGEMITVNARTVNQDTGEIVDAAVVTIQGNGKTQPVAESPNAVTAAQLKRINQIGSQYYGDEWETMRHDISEKLSKGRTKSSKELTQIEADTFIRGIERKIQAKMDEVTYHAHPIPATPAPTDGDQAALIEEAAAANEHSTWGGQAL